MTPIGRVAATGRFAWMSSCDGGSGSGCIMAMDGPSSAGPTSGPGLLDFESQVPLSIVKGSDGASAKG